MGFGKLVAVVAISASIGAGASAIQSNFLEINKTGKELHQLRVEAQDLRKHVAKLEHSLRIYRRKLRDLSVAFINEHGMYPMLIERKEGKDE